MECRVEGVILGEDEAMVRKKRKEGWKEGDYDSKKQKEDTECVVVLEERVESWPWWGEQKKRRGARAFPLGGPNEREKGSHGQLQLKRKKNKNLRLLAFMFLLCVRALNLHRKCVNKKKTKVNAKPRI
jgi:hypothetical protein